MRDPQWYADEAIAWRRNQLLAWLRIVLIVAGASLLLIAIALGTHGVWR